MISCILLFAFSVFSPSVCVCSLSCVALLVPVLKTFVKMKLKSSLSLSEPEMRVQLLSQVREENMQKYEIK